MFRYSSIIVIITFSLFTGCQQLPTEKGVFIQGDNKIIKVEPNKILFQGTLMQTINGLPGSCSREFTIVDKIIVNTEDHRGTDVKISRLEFKKSGFVKNIGAKTSVLLNYWCPVEIISATSKPVKNKDGMLIITPTKKLANGYYAIHFGGLTSSNPIDLSMDKEAYEFIVGKSDNYLSYKDMVNKRYHDYTVYAERLLKDFNSCYNDQNYSTIDALYRPDRSVMSTGEKAKFISESKHWFNEAGKIIESKITGGIGDWQYFFDSDMGGFSITTKYEKRGETFEQMSIFVVNDSAFIGEIK